MMVELKQVKESIFASDQITAPDSASLTIAKRNNFVRSPLYGHFSILVQVGGVLYMDSYPKENSSLSHSYQWLMIIMIMIVIVDHCLRVGPCLRSIRSHGRK